LNYKKKLFIVTTLHRADDHRIYHKEILSLKDNYDITLLCPQDKVPDNFHPPIKIDAFSGGESKIERVRILFHLIKKLSKIKESIVIFHDFELIYIIFILRIFAENNIYIFDMHEDYPSQVLLTKKIPALMRFPLYFFLMMSEIGILPLFDWLFTADDFLKNKYSNLMKGRIAALFNFPQYKKIERQQDFKKPLSIVYAGGLYFERGLKELVELASKLKECKIHIFGRTFTTEENKYLEHSLKKQPNIIYHGYISYENLLKILPEMDIGLVLMKPNKKFRRNISVKQFDYMICGMPVIIKKGLISFIKDNETGFNVSGVDEAVIRINNLTEDDIKRMGRNAVRAIKEKYNWEREYVKMKEGLKRVVILRGASESQECRQVR